MGRNVLAFGNCVQVGDSKELRVEGHVVKPEEFSRVLEETNLSLCCLPETRWKSEDVVRFGEYSILFSGLVPEAHRSIQGVGIALNADLLKA